MIDFDDEGLAYDPDTGVFTRTTVLGKEADASDGYVRIKIGGKTWMAHRLAWIYKYGSIPEGYQIDHINGVRHDNRISNLRLATQAQQCQNRKKRSNNTSGHVGVTFNKALQAWAARVNVDGERIHLGYFASLEEAVRVREEAKARLHTFNPVQR